MAIKVSVDTIPVTFTFPTTEPVVIPTNDLALVKYKLVVSTTFEVVRLGYITAFALLSKLTIFAAVNNGVTAETTRAVV